MRDYSDATPDVTFYYDGKGLGSVPAYSKGKLTRVSSSISDSRYTSFDLLGRLLQTQQITGGNIYNSSYQYNLAGALTQETYPSGRVVNMTYTGNGDISLIQGTPSGGTQKTYAQNFTYTPDGKIKQLKLGNGLWETAQFNNRLQVTEFDLGTTQGGNNVWKANYDFGELQTNGSVDVTKNSGNIAKQTVTFTGLANPFVQAYKYDPLDRITEAKETVNGTQTWIQNWGYDRYGNRSSFTQNLYGYTSVSSPSIDTANNRFKSGQSYTFDKNGNVTVDEAGHQFTYNGDNKPTQVTLSLEKGGTTTLGQYYYDGEGKRVKKTTYTSDNVIFVYANGKLVEERNASTNAVQTSYIYAGSQLLATETATATNYTATDQLGSPRVITDQTGAVVSRRDFMPFGEELFVDGTYRKTSDKYSTSGQDAVRQRFTGYQKDTETGLDFAEARYYQNQHGRFTAVDPLLASGKSANPQTFNRYVYTMNRPLLLTDPTGMIPDWVQKDGEVFYDSRVTDQQSATDLYGDGAKYRPNGDQYVAKGGSNIELLKGGNFKQNREMFYSPDRSPVSESTQPAANTTFGFGGTFGESAAFGLLGGGAETADVSGGYFFDSQRQQNFVSGSALTYAAQVNPPMGGSPETTLSIPSAENQTVTFGKSAGVGMGGFITNAGAPEQLAGTFFTRQLNTPIFSAQYSTGNGIGVFSMTFGPATGGSYWQGTTNTITSPSLVPIRTTPILGPRLR